MKIHFSGIGGIGISALAQLCHSRGDQISGSDIAKSEIWTVLENLKIPLFLQQTHENITDEIDLLVYSEAVPLNNPERVEAKKLNIPQKSFFQFLGEISRNYKTIAIAGTHGKTTTAGFLMNGFAETEFDTTCIIGSTLKLLKNNNFKSGKNNYLLVEACEYRENFRFLSPDILVLTNIEWDHPDFYKSEKQYFAGFEKLIQNSKKIIFNENEQNITKILENFQGEKIYFKHLEKLDLQLFGDFNQKNANLALALGKELNLNLKKFTTGLENFIGAGRRQQFLGQKNGVLFYDDYAHHPSEITALIKAFRQKFPHQKIGLIYEPHQFSRTRIFCDEFAKSLDLADFVGLFPIYEARDSELDKQFSLENLANKSDKFELVPNNLEDLQKFAKKFKNGDVVIFGGAGIISGVAQEFMRN